jgi:hypothetical protein
MSPKRERALARELTPGQSRVIILRSPQLHYSLLTTAVTPLIVEDIDLLVTFALLPLPLDHPTRGTQATFNLQPRPVQALLH